jgi:EmrB/QacA subfamily drug resistance transporter
LSESVVGQTAGMARSRIGSSLPPEVWPIAIVVIVGAIMSILDTTIVNVALQTLRTDLGASLATIQWVSTAYLLALSAVIPLTGWAAERLGPRRVWMTVVAAFVLSSALCGLAWSAEVLIGFRVLQGLAGGMIMPVGMITLAQAAGPQHMGRTMSVVGVPMLLAPVLGPVLGGLLVDDLSWRWIFYVNVPIGVVGLALAAKLLPSERALGHSGEEVPLLDWPGLLMLSPGVAAIVFGLSEYGQHRTPTVTIAWLPVLIGVLLVTAFVRHALRVRFPIVEIRLFASRGFAAAAATTFLIGAALFGSMILLPLYYQIARGESALQAGLLIVPQGLGAAVAMNVGVRLTDRYGGGRVIPYGLVCIALGTLPFALVSPHTPYWLLGLGLVFRGFGLGGSMMPAMAAAYATLERHEVPRATPMLNVLQRVGGSLGVAIFTVILENGIDDRRAHGVGPSGAFAHTYLWAVVAGLIALVPAFVLRREEARARRAGKGGEQPPQPVAA